MERNLFSDRHLSYMNGSPTQGCIFINSIWNLTDVGSDVSRNEQRITFWQRIYHLWSPDATTKRDRPYLISCREPQIR